MRRGGWQVSSHAPCLQLEGRRGAVSVQQREVFSIMVN